MHIIHIHLSSAILSLLNERHRPWHRAFVFVVATSLLNGCNRSPQHGVPLPAEAEKLLLTAGLTKSDLKAAELVDDSIDGWWVKVPAGIQVLGYYQQNWISEEKQFPNDLGALKTRSQEWAPPKWKNLLNSSSCKLFVQPGYDPSVEGKDNFVACFDEKVKYLVVWCSRNF